MGAYVGWGIWDSTFFQDVRGRWEGQISKVFQRYFKVWASFGRNGRFWALLVVPFFPKMSGVAGSVKRQRYFRGIAKVPAVLGEMAILGVSVPPIPPSSPHKPRSSWKSFPKRPRIRPGPGQGLSILTARLLGPSRLHQADFDPAAHTEGFSRRRDDGRMRDFAHSDPKGSAANALEMGRTKAKRWPSRRVTAIRRKVKPGKAPLNLVLLGRHLDRQPHHIKASAGLGDLAAAGAQC